MTVETFHARQALLAEGWAEDTRISVQDGMITGIESGVAPAEGDQRVDHLLPAMSNHHSHAFQRAMSGLAETRGSGTDTFWTWRDVMYRFALAMDPDQMEAVATQLYMEMLEAGFVQVGEFHYLHHDRDGRPYAEIGEMSERLVAAAEATGIGLTLLPSFYAHSTFGGLPPVEGQRRFICDPDGFARILERCRALAAPRAGVNVGVAPHSLRAVTPAELEQVLAMADGAPVHMHVAEQIKEVDDCVAWSGLRPAEWLLQNAPLDVRWCFIHATHLTEAELEGLLAAGVHMGLCPITEGNLGDGISRSRAVFEQGGSFGIGTDSNVSISIPDELRQLEYSQRLTHHNRAVIARQGASTGRELYQGARAGGSAALGVSTDLGAGAPATFLAFDTAREPWLQRDRLMDRWIFGTALRPDGVWVRGRQVVRSGTHVARERIEPRFRATMKELMSETGLI